MKKIFKRIKVLIQNLYLRKYDIQILCKYGYNENCKNCYKECNFMLTNLNLKCDICKKKISNKGYNHRQHEYWFKYDKWICLNCLSKLERSN